MKTTKGKNGYVYIRPNGRKLVLQHRYVMGQKIGRNLNRSEAVHHHDGNRTNNKIENLQLMSRSEHAKMHCSKQWEKDGSLTTRIATGTRYTIKEFRKEFGNEDKCLDILFRNKYPNAKQYYRVRGRKCYAHSMTAHQIHPLKGSIFEKSSTPLTVWFEALFLFSISKNGVSAKELQRHFGFTYKTAWRMGHQLRKLMTQDGDFLGGIVEVDETYFGKKGNNQTKFKNKTALMGMVERKGRVRAHTIEARQTHILLGSIKANVGKGASVVSDEFRVYAKLPKLGYDHWKVRHGIREYVRGNVHTNTIEGFWGQLKRSIRGTYHFVSAKHLQAYVDEFAFRYNQRLSPVPCFQTLVSRAVRQ